MASWHKRKLESKQYNQSQKFGIDGANTLEDIHSIKAIGRKSICAHHLLNVHENLNHAYDTDHVKIFTHSTL